MSGQNAIFLPGFMCDQQLFAPQFKALSAQGVSCYFEGLAEGMSVQRMAQIILKRSPSKFALIGLSMGGIVAFELYRQAPERITHLALLNTTARTDTISKDRKQQLGRVAHGNLTRVLREDLKVNYLSSSNKTPELLSLLSAMGTSLGEHVFCRQTLALITRPSSLPTLADITCPTLVLGGADDTVCPPSRHYEMADQIRDCDLQILADCGHISTLEQAEQVNASLLKLLQRKPAKRPSGDVLSNPLRAESWSPHLTNPTKQ